jgi:hypothetical protein
MDEFRRVSTRLPSGSFPPDDVDEPVVPGSVGDVVAGAAADEAAAAEARRRYQSERMASLGPDPAITPLLAPGEEVLAVRRCVGFERRLASRGKVCAGRGDLYLTSARLVLLGQTTFAIGLDEIEEAMLSGGRLLLVLHDGAGMSLELERPLLLRVEIATARAAARS